MNHTERYRNVFRMRGFKVPYILRRYLQPTRWGPLVRKSWSWYTLTIKMPKNQRHQSISIQFLLTHIYTTYMHILISRVNEVSERERESNQPSTVHTTHVGGVVKCCSCAALVCWTPLFMPNTQTLESEWSGRRLGFCSVSFKLRLKDLGSVCLSFRPF